MGRSGRMYEWLRHYLVLFVISLAIEGSVSLGGPDGVHPDLLLVVAVALPF